MIDTWRTQIDRHGYAILPGVYDGPSVDAIVSGLAMALNSTADKAEAIRSSEGTVFAARNILSLYPAVRQTWRRPVILELLRSVLGLEFGLVRVLFFDKPPEHGWSLPWHKDMTIAVRDNRLPSRHFKKPTVKAGVPHVEASLAVLQAMLTVRVHLDAATEENGPLKIMSGSHHAGKQLTEGPSVSVLVDRGDVLAMRPLLAHASDATQPETTLHRRILHFEFAGQSKLPDGYEWHEFYRSSD